MAKKLKFRQRTVRPLIVGVSKAPTSFRLPALYDADMAQDFDTGAFNRFLTRPIGLARPETALPALPAVPGTGHAADGGNMANNAKMLFMVVAGDYEQPCLFDGKQFLRDCFEDGSAVPLFNYDTAQRLIKKSNDFRNAQGYTPVVYRAIPVFEMTIYND